MQVPEIIPCIHSCAAGRVTPGTDQSMNLTAPVLSPEDIDSATPPAEFSFRQTLPLPFTRSAPPDAVAPSGTTALMTRKIMPGTSVRRLRNHRSAWPRRGA